jgi:hypothetical protein
VNLYPGILDITPDEIVQFLLDEAGQVHRDAVNPAEILEYLRLAHYTENLDSIIPPEARVQGMQPRALLSFRDRLVITHSKMMDVQARFSVLHEIAHYVLPEHQCSMYLCDKEGLGFGSHLQFEREANQFAANLLFKGNTFRLDANSHPLSAKTVENLASKYQSSLEATARRLVESNFGPCMLVVFEREPTHDRVDINVPKKWSVRYYIPSPKFKRCYFSRVTGTLTGDTYDILSQPGHPIADSLIEEVEIKTWAGGDRLFKTEFFSNTYNIFCFLQPLAKHCRETADSRQQTVDSRQ